MTERLIMTFQLWNVLEKYKSLHSINLHSAKLVRIKVRNFFLFSNFKSEQNEPISFPFLHMHSYIFHLLLSYLPFNSLINLFSKTQWKERGHIKTPLNRFAASAYYQFNSWSSHNPTSFLPFSYSKSYRSSGRKFKYWTLLSYNSAHVVSRFFRRKNSLPQSSSLLDIGSQANHDYAGQIEHAHVRSLWIHM